jgi:RNA polymerase sigma factor (sigma-70 family)
MVKTRPYPFILKNLAMTQLQLETSFLLYRQRIFDFCLTCLHNQHDAEDVTMSLFLSLCKTRETIVFETVENYMMTSARNRVIDFKRNQKFLKRVMEQYRDLGENITFQDDSNYILKFIETLPPKIRESFKLRHIYGLNRHQISKIMGSSPITVRNNIAAAMAKINTFIKAQ